MPDGYYGLSKAYGELMGRMYWFKHGVENINVRIGSCFPEPVDARMLSTWLSYADLTRLVMRATLAEKTGSCVIWGASNNARTYWRHDSRQELGWQPARTATEALAELIEGMRAGTDYATPPLSSETSGPLRIQELRTGVGARP